MTGFYFAPLEGITGYIFRNTYEKHFGGFEKYFTPFITTNQHFAFEGRSRKDLLPENNRNLCLVPQILSNHGEQFVDMAKKLNALGYEEINLNLGCPSRTVVTKRKGSGFLAYPEDLDRFLDEIFYNDLGVKISIKTRIGMENPEEFEKLLQIYNKYPLYELIVHPRLQSDYYKNDPDMEVFEYCLEHARAPICYNGDLFTAKDVENFQEKYPKIEKIMLGRGPLKAPTLLRELNGEPRDFSKWHDFLKELADNYKAELQDDKNTLFKMKELWYYLFQSLPDDDKAVKKMRKVKDLQEYHLLVKSILV